MGDTVNIEVVEDKIVIKQCEFSYSLDELLKISPHDVISLDGEDAAWLNDVPAGNEQS